MSRFSRLEVYNTLLDTGLAPLFYHGDTATAVEVVAACVRGGSRLVEFTNRGEDAYPVFASLAKQAPAGTILGVGSVMDAPTAALFLAAGANFIVSPSFNPEVARLCNRRKVAYLPGCLTPTEIAQAEEWGAEVVKIFPGNIGGPEFIRALLGPCPWTRMMPTGGVDATEASITQWIGAGAAAVGLGSKLISGPVIKARAWDELAATVAQCLAWVKKARYWRPEVPATPG
jgi:2-dehydro-3-deoxyphosphogluconate aldolase/(4S)-4-hydroxy-2-oxoglutarate aldolase